MAKKVLGLLTVLTVVMIFIVPSQADPTDTRMDQQVVLVAPGSFEKIDRNHDGRVESLKVKIRMTSCRQGNFIMTGRLEGMKHGKWTALGTTVTPFHWTPRQDTADILFDLHTIRHRQISGPYRASVSLRLGNWEMPLQVIGFSPQYAWTDF